MQGLSHADVLDFLIVKIPEDFDRRYPNPKTFGLSKRAEAGQRAAEAMVAGAAPLRRRRQPEQAPATA